MRQRSFLMSTAVPCGKLSILALKASELVALSMGLSVSRITEAKTAAPPCRSCAGLSKMAWWLPLSAFASSMKKKSTYGSYGLRTPIPRVGGAV